MHAHTHRHRHRHTHTHCPHRPVYEKNHGWPNSLAMSRKNKLAKVAFHPPVPVTDCIKHIQTIMGLYIKRFSCLIYHKFRANQTGMRRTLEFFFFFGCTPQLVHPPGNKPWPGSESNRILTTGSPGNSHFRCILNQTDVYFHVKL